MIQNSPLFSFKCKFNKLNFFYTRIKKLFWRLHSSVILAFSLLVLVSCAAQETTHGNQIDVVDIDKIQLGITHKTELKMVLGPPSFEGIFTSKKLYYSNVKRQSPLGRQAVINSSDLYAFEFDENDILLNMIKIEKIPDPVDFETEKTEAPGVKLGILEQIFFNLRRRQNTE